MSMRTNLLTKFVCSKCGENLTLTYDVPKSTKCIEGEPTGAAMVQYVIAINPCTKCLRPLKEIQGAIKTLISQSDTETTRT